MRVTRLDDLDALRGRTRGEHALREKLSHVQGASLAETSAGPADAPELSLQEFSSYEVIARDGSYSATASHGPGELDAGFSWMTEPQLSVASVGRTGHASLLRQSTSQIDKLLHKTPTVALTEVPQWHSGNVTPKTKLKRMLHVEPAPYHECVAFSKVETEEERDRMGNKVPHMLHPGTQRRFQDLREAGPFPRKQLLSGGSQARASSELQKARIKKAAMGFRALSARAPRRGSETQSLAAESESSRQELSDEAPGSVDSESSRSSPPSDGNGGYDAGLELPSRLGSHGARMALNVVEPTPVQALFPACA